MFLILLSKCSNVSQEDEESLDDLQSIKSLYRAFSAKAQWGRGRTRKASNFIERSKSEVVKLLWV